MRGASDILLLSTYELGHQPMGIASPMAFLERAGFHPAANDLQVEPLDEERVRAARLIAISVPMHTAARLGLAAAIRIRELNPAAALCFHGLYALMHAPLLRSAGPPGATFTLGAECEDDLVELAQAIEVGEPLDRFAQGLAGGQRRPRAGYLVPSRAGLPAPDRYARLVDAAGERLAGYAEATRGCKHRCRHCPLPPVYGGRFFAVPIEVVRADISQQVARGATHITFGDPDFLNGPSHALRVAGELHRDFPGLTFDFTAKVEHLVRHAALLPELAACGAIFVVSAVESLSERVLAKLDKGHTREDALRAFALCQAAGIALRPSLLPFTPWSTLDEYLDLLNTIEREGWLSQVDPVQLSVRLLVPPGSLLIGDPELALGELEPGALAFPWRHPDPRMDLLQSAIARLLEEDLGARRSAAETFERIRQLALAQAGRPHRHVAQRPGGAARRVAAPRLTESWFC